MRPEKEKQPWKQYNFIKEQALSSEKLTSSQHMTRLRSRRGLVAYPDSCPKTDRPVAIPYTTKPRTQPGFMNNGLRSTFQDRLNPYYRLADFSEFQSKPSYKNRYATLGFSSCAHDKSVLWMLLQGNQSQP